MSEEKYIIKIIEQIKKNVYSKKWKCIIEECNETAINSHLLQRNGILNTIAENGHLIELKTTDAFSWSKNKTPFEFKRVGIGSALSLSLFCNKCDAMLFKSIESKNSNLVEYQTFVLLNYRTTCAEQRKKEQVVEWFKRLLNAETLKGKINAGYIKTFIKGNQLGINDLSILKKVIEREIRNPKQIFHFVTYRYPLIEIYGSAIFSVTDKDEDSEEDERTEFDDVFIHVIPLKEELLILCGYVKKFKTNWISKYIESWANLEKKELNNRLTNLFAARIENWGLSPTLFNNISKETIKKMTDFWKNNASSLKKDIKPDFDLFE